MTHRRSRQRLRAGALGWAPAQGNTVQGDRSEKELLASPEETCSISIQTWHEGIRPYDCQANLVRDISSAQAAKVVTRITMRLDRHGRATNCLSEDVS